MADTLQHELLVKILELLPAKALARAACVCRSWEAAVCAVENQQPRLVSALTVLENPYDAMEEVLSKVLKEPFRPQFALLFVAGHKFRAEISMLLKKNLPHGIPVVGCLAPGIAGRDVVSEELKEIFIPESGLVLVVGRFPGTIVDAVGLPLSPSEEEIQSFVAQACGTSFKKSLKKAFVLLSKPTHILMDVLNGLDSSSSKKPHIAGGICCGTKRGILVHSTIPKILTSVSVEMACLVFCEEHTDNPKNNHFASSMASGSSVGYQASVAGAVVPIGPIYTVVSSRVTEDHELHEWTTWLTCTRERLEEELGGVAILSDLENHANGMATDYIVVQVLQRRGRAKKRKMIGVNQFYELKGFDDEYLLFAGRFIKTGDLIQFYVPDENFAKMNIRDGLDQVERNMITEKELMIGGLLFNCVGRGGQFFHDQHTDSKAFVEKFPGKPLAGMFAYGEVGRHNDLLTSLQYYASSFLMFTTFKK